MISGLGDAGTLTRWGLPVSRFVMEAGGTLTVGVLLGAAVLLPSDAGRARPAGRPLPPWRLLDRRRLGRRRRRHADLHGLRHPRHTGGQGRGRQRAVQLRRPAAPGHRPDVRRPAGRAGRAAGPYGRHARQRRRACSSSRSSRCCRRRSPGTPRRRPTTSSRSAALAMHVVALAPWVGGLLLLVWHAAHRGDHLGVAAQRFSRMALWCYVAVGRQRRRQRRVPAARPRRCCTPATTGGWSWSRSVLFTVLGDLRLTATASARCPR